jgi:hypothetical protein
MVNFIVQADSAVSVDSDPAQLVAFHKEADHLRLVATDSMYIHTDSTVDSSSYRLVASEAVDIKFGPRPWVKSNASGSAILSVTQMSSRR